MLYYFFIKKYSIFIINNRLYLYNNGILFTYFGFFFYKEKYSDDRLYEITKNTSLSKYHRIFIFRK